MLCGIELCTEISENHADILSTTYNLYKSKGSRDKDEKCIAGKGGTFIRKNIYSHLVLELRKKGSVYEFTIRGSWQKFYKGNNSTDFYGYEILETKQRIIELFNLDPKTTQIINIETSINIPTVVPVFQYLKSNLLYHRKKQVIPPGDLIQSVFCFKHDDYLLKLYAKSKYLFRFENKITSKNRLIHFGLHTLQDINETTISSLSQSIAKEFSEVVMRDGITVFDKKKNIHSLTMLQRERLLEYTSTLYAQSYQDELNNASTKQKKDALRQKSHRLKKECLSIIKAKGDHTHEMLLSQMIKKLNWLNATWQKASKWNLNDENVTISRYDKKREFVTTNNNGHKHYTTLIHDSINHSTINHELVNQKGEGILIPI